MIRRGGEQENKKIKRKQRKKMMRRYIRGTPGQCDYSN